MRIVVDLDGTLCTLRQVNETYEDVRPLPGAKEALERLKKEGHTIIIYTARNMRTCKGNVGKVTANVGKITLDWLENYNFPFDELVFGKPEGDVYIDDLAMTFSSWSDIKFPC